MKIQIGKKLYIRQINKLIHLNFDLIKSFKADLYDIEHDNFPDDDYLRQENIRRMLVTSDSKDLDQHEAWLKNKIKELENNNRELVYLMMNLEKGD